jgi:uncharacterized coiled-coil protein SlyX
MSDDTIDDLIKKMLENQKEIERLTASIEELTNRHKEEEE